MAVSLLLLIVVGLVTRTLINLYSLDPGFRTESVLLFSIEPATSGYRGERLMSLYSTVSNQTRELPGVQRVGMSRFRPMTQGQVASTISFPGESRYDPSGRGVQGNRVDSDFFEAMGIPVLLGRSFGSGDVATSPKVAVINETMARHFFADRNPVGQRFGFGGKPAEYIEIVGVVRDAKYHDLREKPVRMVYQPYSQEQTRWLGSMEYVVRTNRDSLTLIPAIQQMMRKIAPEVPVVGVNTLSEQVDRTLIHERLLTALCGFFGVLGLVIAMVGLYGVMSFRVNRRRAEIGIRMALGARSSTVMGMILREVFCLVIGGAAVGLLMAVPATRTLKVMLFGVEPYDLTTVLAALVVLFLAAGLAGLIPALRAARVDPLWP